MSAPIFDQDGRPVEGAGASAPASAVAASAAPVGGGGMPAEPEFQPMSLDDARALLVRVHSVAIGHNDPILMLVTLHQGFCADLEKLLSRHSERVCRMLAETGNGLAEIAERALETLKDKTVKASLDHSFALIQSQAEAMQTLHRRLRRFGWVLGALTVVNIAAVGLTLAILSNVVR